MFHLKFALISISSFLLGFNLNSQTWQWTRTSKQAFEDPYPSEAKGKTTCVDRDGNLYVIAMYRDTLDFGFNDDPNDEESLFEPDFQSGSGAILLKYSPQGSLLLAQKLGTVTEVNKSVLDFSGKFLYVVGSFSQNTSFGGKPINTQNNLKQTFVAKLDVSLQNPQAVWATTVGSNLKVRDTASIAVDFSGNCYLTSQFSGVLNITQNFFLQSQDNNTEVYLTKLNSNTGKAEWADVIRGIGGSLDNVSKDISFSFSSGALYVVGAYQGNTVQVLGANKIINANADQGYVIVKYQGSSSGSGKPSFAWATTIGSKYGLFDFETLIAADDRNQNLAIAGGYFANTSLIFDDAVVALDDVDPNNLYANQNAFLATLHTSDGSLKWVKRAISPVKSERVARNQGLTIDSAGGIYLTGWAVSVSANMPLLQFDDAPQPLQLTPFLAKVYHVKYNKGGTFQWQLLSADGISNEFEAFTGSESNDICVDKNFNVYSTGNFTGTDVTFNPTPTLPLTGENHSQQTCIWTGRLKQP